MRIHQAFLHGALCVAVFTPVLAACASSSDPELTPQQAAAVDATCDKVMKLRPGAQFEACVSSLSDTVASMEDGDYAASAYSSCGRNGISYGAPEFARCVLDREAAARASGSRPVGAAAKLNAAMIKPVVSDQNYYMDGSIPVRRRRERYACAAVGLAPGSGLFDACTDELETQIYFVDHSNNPYD